MYGAEQAPMARGVHGLPKVSPRLTMPDPFRPCRWATPKTALWPFWGWPACRGNHENDLKFLSPTNLTNKVYDFCHITKMTWKFCLQQKCLKNFGQFRVWAVLRQIHSNGQFRAFSGNFEFQAVLSINHSNGQFWAFSGNFEFRAVLRRN
jgi:hypothetical protein